MICARRGLDASRYSRRVALDLRLAVLAALDLVAQSLQPGGELRPVDRRRKCLRLEKSALLQRVGVAVLALGHVEDDDVRVKLRRGVAVDRPGGVVLEGRRHKLPVCSGSRTLPMRAWVYRSNSLSATRTLSRCASRTRSSPPTSAVSETDFGAEIVASQPARWPTEVTSLPYRFSYVRDGWCQTICSCVVGCSPSVSRAKCSAPTSPLSPNSAASLPCHSLCPCWSRLQ